jgi:hypothetical protein
MIDWYGRQRDGGRIQVQHRYGEHPLLNGITACVHTCGAGVYFESYCGHRGFGDNVGSMTQISTIIIDGGGAGGGRILGGGAGGGRGGGAGGGRILGGGAGGGR